MGVAAYLPWGFSVRERDGIVNLYGNRVTANLFRVLGVQAAVGRTFAADEDNQPVVMLGYDYWRRMSGDPGIIGQTITIGGQKHTIVGVVPADFFFSVRDANLFVPNLDRDAIDTRVVGRLASGVSPEQAQAEVRGILQSFESQQAAEQLQSTRVIPLSEAFRSGDSSTVVLLQATVALVLLITCVNVANLLLVRSSARRREFAIRSALGGSRRQLFGQLMSEGAMLAGLGGTLGLLLANWSLNFVHSTLPANITRRLRGEQALSIDERVLVFAAGMSVLTLLVFGLTPAIHALRFDVMPALRDSAKGGSPERQRLGQLLVTGEVALALMLLIGAGLTLKSLAGLQRAYLGFSADHVMRAAVNLLESRYPRPEQRLAVFDEMIRRLEALPGVETVGALAPQFFPFGGPRVRGARFEIQGKPGVEARAEVYTANPAYFRSVQIPLLKGRVFAAADTAASAPVALISDVVARRYWGQDDPIGRMVRLNSDQQDSPWVTIVGIVGDVKNPVALDVQPTAYRPLAQMRGSGAILLVRTRGQPMALAEAVRRELQAADPTGPAGRLADLEAAVRDYVSPQRFTTSVLGFFAGLGLLLAAVGVYGVTRYWVAARVPEIGIRLALGARRQDVLRLVLVRACRAVIAGIVMGIAGALALRQIIASQLYGVSPTDPAVFVAVSLVMGLAALGAALLPARWAANVDPLVAVKYE
jgi:putative ABC transport system permease protein